MDSVTIVALWGFMFTNVHGVEEVSIHHSMMGCVVSRQEHVEVMRAEQNEALRPGECARLPDDVSISYQYYNRTE